MGRKSKISLGLFAAVRDGDMSQSEAARRAGISRQGFEQAFMTFRAEQTRNRSTRALTTCANWLAACLRFGFSKGELDGLERLWWRWHDENGNLLKEPRI